MNYHPCQETADKYHKRLIGHFSNHYNAVQVRKQRPEKTEADYLRPHRRANNVGCETYCEGCYYCFLLSAVNGEEYHKD